MLAELALEFDVKAFVYSSSIPAGIKDAQIIDLSHKAKWNIERCCMELGTKGLNWM